MLASVLLVNGYWTFTDPHSVTIVFGLYLLILRQAVLCYITNNQATETTELTEKSYG